MPLSLRGALLALLITVLHRNLLAVDNQAIALSLAFAAHGSVAHSRSMAGITRDR
jgi:hypothetical protein